MKCVICHGQDIRYKEVKEEISFGNNIVFIPVKILVCQTCGERYYDRRTMQFLEEIEEKIRNTKVKLKEIGKVLICGEINHIG